MIRKMDSKFIKTIFALYCLALAYILFFTEWDRTSAAHISSG